MAITIGYKYFFGIHMGICRGSCCIVEVRVGDRSVHSSTDEESGNINFLDPVREIDLPDLFGGEEGEGGIVGRLIFLPGRVEQEPPIELENMYGEPVPAYRGVSTVFFDGMISAINPYPKPWKFRVRSQEINQIGGPPNPDVIVLGDQELHVSGSKELIYSKNPSNIMREVLTDRVIGRGLPSYMLDFASWNAARDALYEEAFGLCLKWSRRDSVESFIQSVLDHVGGVIFTDRRTGLLKIRLLRGGYDVEALPLFTQELGLCEITELTNVANSPLINEVRVTYRDPLTNEDRVAVARNPAMNQTEGQGINSLSRDYPGLPTAELALKVAQRDLKAQGGHLRRCTVKFNRIGWKIEPGQVIKLQDLSRGLTPTVFRVASIEDGGLGNGWVVVKCIQDVFSLPETTFAGHEPPRWEPPSNRPCLADHKVFEMPYYMLARTMAQADFDLLGEEAAYVGTLAAKGQPLNIAYDIATRPDAPTPDDDAADGYYCDGYTPPI